MSKRRARHKYIPQKKHKPASPLKASVIAAELSQTVKPSELESNQFVTNNDNAIVEEDIQHPLKEDLYRDAINLNTETDCPYLRLPNAKPVNLVRKIIDAADNIQLFLNNYNLSDPSHGKYSIYGKYIKNGGFKILQIANQPDKNGNYDALSIEMGGLIPTDESDKEESTSLTIHSVDTSRLIVSNNKDVKMMYNYFLAKANEQCYSGDSKRLYSYTINFTISDLVTDGLYNNEQRARLGFDAGANALSGLKIRMGEGPDRDNPFEGGKSSEIFQPFTNPRRVDGNCSVQLSSTPEFQSFFRSFSFLPRYIFGLNSRAQTLLTYACSLARQHADDIRDTGYFKISAESVRLSFNLTDPTGDPHANRSVEIIKRAVADINEAQFKTEHPDMQNTEEQKPDNIYIDMSQCNEYKRAKDFFKKGYITIYMSGAYREFLESIADKQDDKAKKAIARRERISEAVEVKRRLNRKKKSDKEEYSEASKQSN